MILNDALTEVGEDAFNGCTSLFKVSGGKNVSKIAFFVKKTVSVNSHKKILFVLIGSVFR